MFGIVERRMRVLFATSEVYPLMKTGGLADVSAGLPAALVTQGVDARVLLPGYGAALEGARDLTLAATLPDVPGGGACTLMAGLMPDTGVPVLLVNCPAFFDRPGSPYLDPQGHDWLDNAQRFALLARVGSWIARGEIGLDWQPDVVHCNDWQTGLLPAYLALEGKPCPPTVFTIHNLAFQGNFPASLLAELDLPPESFNVEGLEFWNTISFLKAGLYYSNLLFTVSPTYAREIQTKAFGAGMEGLLAKRADTLFGLLNGVDYDQWDPTNDPHLVHPYKPADTRGKALNKAALQTELGLARDAGSPLFVIISRLTDQKGMDIILDAAPAMLGRGIQLAVQGEGYPEFESGFRALAASYPRQVAVRIGYSETFAHRLQAGGDVLLMPSRSEPCGLTQLYAQRYATIPLVRRVGGLADSVVDATPANEAAGIATGFQLDELTAEGLLATIDRLLAAYHRRWEWRKLQLAGIGQDFSWYAVAEKYNDFYAALVPEAGPRKLRKA